MFADQFISTCIKFDVARYVFKFIRGALENCGLHPESGFSIPLQVS